MSIKSLAACAAPLLLAFAPCAQAERTLTLGAAHTDYTRDLGTRTLLTGQWKHKAGDDTWLLGAAAGDRDFGVSAYQAARLSGTWYRRWSDTISTRTAASVATDDPVFARHQIDQDVTFRTSTSTNVTAGVKHSRYFGDIDALSLSLGGAVYIDRVTLRYRYTHHDLSPGRDGSAHLLSARLADRKGAGSTQLWLGMSDVLQDYDWSPTPLPGQGRSLAVRRVQPLTDALALKVGVERAHQDAPTGDYTATTLNVGLRIGF